MPKSKGSEKHAENIEMYVLTINATFFASLLSPMDLWNPKPHFIFLQIFWNYFVFSVRAENSNCHKDWTVLIKNLQIGYFYLEEKHLINMLSDVENGTLEVQMNLCIIKTGLLDKSFCILHIQVKVSPIMM